MYILIDIGETKTRVATTKDGDSFTELNAFDTSHDFSTWLANLHKTTEFILLNKALRGVIVGLPGSCVDGIITKTKDVPTWQGTPIREHLEKLFSTAITLRERTELVGLGEAIYGAGKGHDIAAYLAIGRGVDGIRIVDGQIDRSTYGFDIGHSIIDIEHDSDVETLLGSASFGHPLGKSSHEVHTISLWEKLTRQVGVFGANTIMYWSPSVVVYDGPLMKDLHMDTIERETKRLLGRRANCPIFVHATLKDHGGLYGALALSKQMLEVR